MTQEREQRSGALAINDEVVFEDTLPLKLSFGFSQIPFKESFPTLFLISPIPIQIIK